MKFGVRLEGMNYELLFEEQQQVLGFVTTRFVKAKTQDEAELKAVDLIRNDESLNRIMVSGSLQVSTLRVTELWQESWWKKTGGKGYTFFPMESNEEI